MTRFLLVRLVQSVFTFAAVATLVFFVLRAGPGDPSAYIVDPAFPESVRQSILRSFGLDRPLGWQYISYMSNVMRGEFGVSFFSGRSVLSSLGDPIRNTLILGIAAMLLSYPISIAAGVYLASRRGRRADSIGLAATTTLRAIPEFWLALLSVTVFSFYLGWFPGSGMRSVGRRPKGIVETYFNVDFLHHLALPAFTAAMGFIALPLLLTRTSMLDVLGEDYVEFARSKGFTERRVLVRHGLRNALIPIATEAAISLGLLMGNLVVIETVFSWPGVGREMVMAVSRKDYPTAQGAFLVMSAGVIIMSSIADIVYGLLDPRIGTPGSTRVRLRRT